MNILRMTAKQHQEIKGHLFPGDGCEAVTVALCGRARHIGRNAWIVHRVVCIPYAECLRGPDFVTWPTKRVRALLAEAAAGGMSILKIHSHPTGFAEFSSRDDHADAELFAAIGRRVDDEHVSAVMLPDGRIFARRMKSGTVSGQIERVSVVGDDLTFRETLPGKTHDFDLRHRQMFGDRTTDQLAALSVGIVGVSGTGSPTAEMMMRLGVGRLILIEPDLVEIKNLNRIYGAKRSDASDGRNKAAMMRDHIFATDLGTVVEICKDRVDTPDAIALLSTCDVVFGCVDSLEGRDTLNRLATFYSLPYFDLGVRLDADGRGGVSSVSASVHYIQPGGSSLKSRGVYTDDELRAEYLKRTDPSFYEDQGRRGYIRGVRVDRPAVVSINTAIASTAVNELLARVHPFRSVANAEFALVKLLITHGRFVRRPDGDPDTDLARYVGRGDCRPLLMSSRIEIAA